MFSEKLCSVRIASAFLMLLFGGPAHSQSVDVTAQVEMTRANQQKAVHDQSSGVVIWLDPVSQNVSAAKPGHFRLEQKDKSFHPHLLVVPLGSLVDFPNLDPFFHNVFSQFNGKRFDLGLYEEGSNRTVRFDHEGVSYIFCNIHPQMSAVIISLSTPYFAISSPKGVLVLHDVPPATYEMHMWAEGVDAKQLSALTRRVEIGPSQTNLGSFQLVENGVPAHKNKYGQDYFPDRQATY
jgi:plastocyanin